MTSPEPRQPLGDDIRKNVDELVSEAEAAARMPDAPTVSAEAPPLPTFPEIPKRQTPASRLGLGGDGGQAQSMMATGFGFVSLVAGGAVAGWAVDHFFKTQPYGVLVGTLIGLVSGTWRLLRDTGANHPSGVRQPKGKPTPKR